MATIGEVAVKLGLDSKEFIKEIDKAENECKQLEANLNETKRSFEKMSKAMAMTTNPTKEMTSAFNELKNQLRQEQSAFNNFQGKLNKFDGGLSKSTGTVGLLQGALGKLVAGGTILMLGKQMIDYGQKSVEAYRQQDRAIKGLNNALQNAGVYTAEYSNHLQKLSSEIQRFTNYGDEAVEKAIGLGQAYAGNIKLTDELIKATVDYAAATGTDLDTAFNLVGKSIGTDTNALARYGVALDKNMSKEEKMAVITKTLQQRFDGSAKTMADSSVKLQNALGDLSEAFGKWLNPAVEKTQNFLQKGVEKLTHWINKVRVLKSELNNLESVEDLTLKAQQNIKRMNDLIGQSGDYKAAEAFRRENQAIYAKIKEIKEKEKKLAEDSKNNFVPLTTSSETKTSGTKSGGTKTEKTPQDLALEAYKKYIEEYDKLNDDYAATLKARQYIEGTLNIDPIKQADEYSKAFSIYQSYEAKKIEISKSGAANKSVILKLEEEKLARELQELRLANEQETQKKLLEQEKQTQQALAELISGYETQTEGLQRSASVVGGQSNAFLSGLSSQYRARLDMEIWYQDELAKIKADAVKNNYTIQQQQEATARLETLRIQKQTEQNLKIWQQYGSDMSSVLSNSFMSVLTQQQSFGDAMKSMLSTLYTQMIKMLVNEAMKEIEIEKALAAAKVAIRGLMSSVGGIWGSIGGAITGLFSHHSGGMIPGTKEQIAVLQGGERVLNRSEAENYNNNNNNGDGSVNNVMVFNIKAWDGKDVISTLKANENTINQIVSSGIKNNKQGLRTIVQNT